MDGTLLITDGVMGVGKSYFRSGVYPLEYLSDPEVVYCTTSNLNIDNIAEHLQKYEKLDPEETKKRIEIIPPEEVKKWYDEASGPWDYFKSKRYKAWHICIDESHNFISSRHSKPHQKKWLEWIREVRHDNGTVELISQTFDDLPREIEDLSNMIIHLYPDDSHRDPIFNIKRGDWYQLRAKFLTGEYINGLGVRELINIGGGRFREEDERMYTRNPYFYQFYDPWEQRKTDSIAGEEEYEHKGGKRKEWERFSKPKFLSWFISRNWIRLLFNYVTCMLFLAAFFLSGGGKFVFLYAYNEMQEVMKKNIVKNSKAESEPKKMREVMPHVIEAKQKRMMERLEKHEYERLLETYQTVVGERDYYKAQLNSSKLNYVKLLQRFHDIERRVTASITMKIIQPHQVTFADGMTYRVGETIRTGFFKGLGIQRIEFYERAAYLTDGQRIVIADNYDEYDRMHEQLKKLQAELEISQQEEQRGIISNRLRSTEGKSKIKGVYSTSRDKINNYERTGNAAQPVFASPEL